MAPYIKQERGRGGLRAQRQDINTIPTPERTDLGSDVMTDRRAARSGARKYRYYISASCQPLFPGILDYI